MFPPTMKTLSQFVKGFEPLLCSPGERGLHLRACRLSCE